MKIGVKERIVKSLDLPLTEKGFLDNESITKVDEYLHDQYSTNTPVSLHIFGEAPPEKYLFSYITSIMRQKFLYQLEKVLPAPANKTSQENKLAWLRQEAEKMIREFIVEKKAPPEALKAEFEFIQKTYDHLMLTTRETKSLLNALNGGYVRPGPGPDPIKNPASIPSGNNLYALNPEEIPTRASWEVAKNLVDDMIKAKAPMKIAFNLNGMGTMSDFGVVESQIFYLLGVRPIWDASGLVNEVEIIDEKELGRPRIDVFIAVGGNYRNNFASRVKLIDKAVKMVSALKEENNRVYQQTQKQKQMLLAKGYADSKAEMLSTARIFGPKVSQFSTEILYLIPKSSAWETEDEITDIYMENMSYLYSLESWGEKMEDIYKMALSDTDTIITAWSSNMTSPLSNHHVYEYVGGLNMAVTRVTGKKPRALVSDIRDTDSARIRGLEEVLESNLKAELLNRKWIEGMKGHDYAGAGHIAELTKNLFGWAVTREGAIDNGVWNDVYDIYVKDRYKMDLNKWLETVNPHALQEMIAVMLEANRKKYWDADKDTLADLQKLYAELVVKHGMSAGLVSGGNTKLEASIIAGLGNMNVELVEQFKKEIEKTTGENTSKEQVQGTKLENIKEEQEVKKTEETPPATPETTVENSPSVLEYLPYFVLLIVVVAFIAGFMRRMGTPK